MVTTVCARTADLVGCQLGLLRRQCGYRKIVLMLLRRRRQAGPDRIPAGTARILQRLGDLGLSRLCGRAEDHVRAYGGDAARAQLAQQALLHQVALVLAERVDGGPVTGAEHDVPEAAGPVEVVLAGGGHDGRDGGAGEQVRKRGSGGDLIPGVKRPDQRWVDFADRLPERLLAGSNRPGPQVVRGRFAS